MLLRNVHFNTALLYMGFGPEAQKKTPSCDTGRFSAERGRKDEAALCHMTPGAASPYATGGSGTGAGVTNASALCRRLQRRCNAQNAKTAPEGAAFLHADIRILLDARFHAFGLIRLPTGVQRAGWDQTLSVVEPSSVSPL